MKSIGEHWRDGIFYIIQDSTISFYAFFTIALADCAYLWAFKDQALAKQITFILLGYICNVIVFAPLKGAFEVTRLEVVFTVLYDIVFLTLFVIGCHIDKITILLTGLLLIFTAIWIELDEVYIKRKFMQAVHTIFIIAVPFAMLLIFWSKIPQISLVLKIVIPIVYAFLIPLIVFFEDDAAASNVFELAYEIEWSKEEEKFWKEMSKQRSAKKKR